RLSTWKVWLGMVAATAVMIAANVRSAWPDPTAVLMQAWVPAIALWLWHTLAAGRKPRGAPIELGSVWARVTGEAIVLAPAPELPADQVDGVDPTGESLADGGRTEGGESAEAAADAERNPQARVPARAEVRRLLARRGPALDDLQVAERVARRVGVSIPHARRLVREERQPRVVTPPATERASEAREAER
ncbi:MAG TPA: hypothetical protein VIC57_17850, partial [Candidatus Dormibacteraeota bacterium]